MPSASFRLSLLKAFAAILIFGTVPAAISFVSADAFSLGMLRLIVAASAFSLILLLSGKLSQLRALSRTDWRTLVVIGLLFGLHWLTYISSIKQGGAAIGAIGFTTYGVQIPLLGWLFGFGRPAPRTFLALALAISGAGLCLLESSTNQAPATRQSTNPQSLPVAAAASAQPIWLLVAILSGTTYAGLPLLHQRNTHLSHSVRTWAQFAFALPVFLLTIPLAEWNFPRDEFWLLVHLALIVTVVGHFLWVQAATELPLTLTGVLAYLHLPASLTIAWLCINEPLTNTMILGACLVIVGNLIAISDRKNEDSS